MAGRMDAATLAVLPCDFCSDPVAPFGFAPPPRLGIPVRRPLKTCGCKACNERAEARVAALIEKNDPLSPGRRRAAADAGVSRQGNLF
mgnify:CR=1 FL=1